jgi:hypothetical protein
MQADKNQCSCLGFARNKHLVQEQAKFVSREGKIHNMIRSIVIISIFSRVTL